MTLKPGLGSLKVIESDSNRSGTHDFLLTFYSNHDPVSYRFRDKRRYPLKISNFSHPRVFNASAEGVPLGSGYRLREQKIRMMGLPGGWKSFKIDLAVCTQYRRVTDRQTDIFRRQRPRYAEPRSGNYHTSVDHQVCLFFLHCFWRSWFSDRKGIRPGKNRAPSLEGLGRTWSDCWKKYTG